MKMPDDIKKGLECGFCNECPYDSNELETVEECARQVHKDAIAYIQQLESRLAQVERERDAAVEDLRSSSWCEDCKNYALNVRDEPCFKCLMNMKEKPHWQWRGVVNGNTKEGAK